MSDDAEAVALGLLEMLMEHEQLATEFKGKTGPAARAWLFHSYGECLRAVLSGKERAETRLGKGRGDEDRVGGLEGAGQGRRRKGPPVLPLSED